MFSYLAPALLLAQYALSAPVTNAAAATVGKIRGVQSPIYHLYLQANPNNCNHHLDRPGVRTNYELQLPSP